MTLYDFFSQNPRVALGFSGGVDSAFLLAEGLRCGADIGAYFVKTAFQPAFELRDARRLAAELGANLTVLEVDICAHASVSANPPDRCYHCKRVLFEALLRAAANDGYETVMDGSNASDNADDRPGMRALSELSVRSPLRECGITKAQVRALSKDAGLFTWNKPAYACLATRVPARREITPALLRRIECAEDALFALGFTDFRVRVTDSGAKLQLPEAQLEEAVRRRGEIRAAVEPYFLPVLLDLNGRRGGDA